MYNAILLSCPTELVTANCIFLDFTGKKKDTYLVTRKDRRTHETIPTGDKLIEDHLRWYWYIRRRSIHLLGRWVEPIKICGMRREPY